MPLLRDNNLKLCAGALLAFTVLAGTRWHNIDRSARHKLDANDPLVLQIQSDVQKVVEANRLSPTLLDWHFSGYTPSDVLKNIRQLKIPETRKVLCSALRALPDHELAVFEQDLFEPENVKFLRCMGPLREKLERYWRASRKQIENDLRLGAIDKPLLTQNREVRNSRIDSLPGQIAITIHGGTNGKRTERMLDILSASRTKATFFVMGDSTRNQEKTLRKIIKRGHALGSIGFRHQVLTELTLKEAEREIERGRHALEAAVQPELKDLAANPKLPLFRFPYGMSDPNVSALVEKARMIAIPSDLELDDWKTWDPRELVARFKKKLDQSRGGILVLNDEYEQSVLALPYILDEIKARGYIAAVFIPSGEKLAYCKSNACRIMESP
jgi:peptidoglycan/xylan/chitin deacetylase (PgdA/CDA1 family)